MAKIKYLIMQTEINVEDDESMQTYGIACVKDDIVVEYIEDISPDKKSVVKAAEKFTKNHLDPVHFEYAVEDLLP